MAGRETISRMMVVLSAAYPRHEVTADTGRVYAELLHDIPDDVLLAAAKQNATTSKWFPSVAELREAAGNIVALSRGIRTAEEAWLQVQAAMREYGWYGQSDGAGGWCVPRMLSELERKAVDALGGWKLLCHSENAPADRAHFLRIYDNLLKREQEKATMLPAVRETVERLVEGRRLQLQEPGS